MKKTLKTIFSRIVVEPIVIFIISASLLEFVIYPLLTINNTFLNIVAASIATFLGLFLLVYIDGKVRNIFEPKDIILTEEKKKEIITEIKEKGLYQEPEKKDSES